MVEQATARHSIKILILLAVVFTGLNALKPVCIDDTLYIANARQMAVDPLHPYGHENFWYDFPEPAYQVLAPPLFSYYLSVAIRLFGDSVVAWKLFCLPFALLLVFSLRSLLWRFAPGTELPLTIFVIFSPVILPSFNLMLEVPVAALSLASLAVFFRASDVSSIWLALVAGLIAGISMQVKYSAFIVPAVFVLYAFLNDRKLLGVISTAIAIAVFGSFELFLVTTTGHSPWLFQSHTYNSVNLLAKYAYLFIPFFTLFGSVVAVHLVLHLVTLGAGRKWVIAASSLIIGSVALIAILPRYISVVGMNIEPAWLIFLIFGLALCAALAYAAWWLLDTDVRTMLKPRSLIEHRKIEVFLVLWFAGEVLAYFVLSPIPAVRRMVFLTVISALIAGRIFSRTSIAIAERRRLLNVAVIANLILAIIYFSVDAIDASVEKIGAERSVAIMKVRQPAGGWFYTGRWGMQFYSERAGALPIYPGRTELNVGDLVAVSNGEYWTKPLAEYLAKYSFDLIDEVRIETGLPVRTMIGFYDSGIPIHRHDGADRIVFIYRVSGMARSGAAVTDMRKPLQSSATN